MKQTKKTKVTASMDKEIVGEIRYAILTEAQFQQQSGDEWILADGRDVTGSKYHTITGYTQVPDTRGMFLRGKNNGRNDGKENPDGEATLGDYQQDTFSSHNHDAGTYESLDYYHRDNVQTWDDNFGYDDWNETLQYSWRNLRGNSGATGDIETKPKNVTVNIFIKIN